MNIMAKAVLVFSFALAMLTLPVAAKEQEDAPVAALTGTALIEALGEGGYTVFYRHSITEKNQIDASEIDLEDCATQRGLSAEGRELALFIKNALAEHEIPVGEVFSSPYCRCKHTADITFGEDNYSIVDDLQFIINARKPVREKRKKTLRQLLSAPPAEGRNNFIVSHTGNLKEAARIWPKPQGVLVVFRPREDVGFEYIGAIRPKDWPGIPEHLMESEDEY